MRPQFAAAATMYVPLVVLANSTLVLSEHRGVTMARQQDLPIATRGAHFAAVSRLKTLAW